MAGEPASWGEMLRQHKAKQTSCAWKPQDVRVKHVTRFEKSREERQFDPILQFYRDPARDEMSRTRTQQETMYRLNRARDKQLRYTQTFDIITHVPKINEPPGARPKQLKKAKPDTRQTHNIITNINFDRHHYAKPGERPEVNPPTERGPAGCTVKGRDFNIISNKYITNHQTKDAIDKEMARVGAAEKFWQTRDFNPLTCTFYDERKEADYKQRSESKAKNHGTGFNDRLPATIRMSEGVCYDVITMDVKDQKANAKRVAADNKTINSRIALEVEQRVRQRGEKQAELAETRALARVSEDRFKEATRHGYDIVTNQRFAGENARKVHPNRGSTHTKAWDRLQRESRGASGLPPRMQRAATANSPVRPPRSSAQSNQADIEVIRHSARPSSVPNGPSSVRSGGLRSMGGGSVRSGGFAWTQSNDAGGGGGGATSAATPASRASRPVVPRLTLRSQSNGRLPPSKPASPISTSKNSGGLGAPASGGVRTGGFH